jgi:hypothetical protein
VKIYNLFCIASSYALHFIPISLMITPAIPRRPRRSLPPSPQYLAPPNHLLPSSIPAFSPLNPTSLPVKILNPTSSSTTYVKSEYAYIRTYIKELYDSIQDENIDAVIHLGVADGWDFYSVEERAFNERMSSDFWGPPLDLKGYYRFPDDAGRTVLDITTDEGKDRWVETLVGLSCKARRMPLLL